MIEIARVQLVEAIKQGNLSRVQALLEEEPLLIQTQIGTGQSYIVLAAVHKKQDVLRFLVEKKGQLDIVEAAAAGDSARVDTLIGMNPYSVNAFAPDGLTALHVAALIGSQGMVEKLIAHKANVNAVAKNMLKTTPLHSCAIGKHLGVARALLGAGALVHAQQQGGFTPLHIAAGNGDVALAKLFIEFGADVHNHHDGVQSPLSLAEQWGHREMAELLRKEGATV